MNCSGCGNIVGEDSKFCSSCGLEIVRESFLEFCPECGVKNDKNKFCTNCGSSLTIISIPKINQKENLENPQPEKLNEEYFLVQGNNAVSNGRYSISQIKAFIENGSLTKDDLIKKEGSDNWSWLKDFDLIDTTSFQTPNSQSSGTNKEIKPLKYQRNETLLLLWWESITLNYFNFKGYASRKEYGSFLLFSTVASVLSFTLDNLIIADILYSSSNYFWELYYQGYDFYPLTTLLIFYSILPSLSIQSRRLRDAGYNPAWLLIYLLPYLGALILLILLFQRSKPKQHEG